MNLFSRRVILGLSLVATLFVRPLARAQGTRADYTRAMTFSDRISKITVAQSVAPHWLSGNNAFWYRVENGPDDARFVWVDAVRGARRPAFDHEALAAALSRETRTEVRPGQLPFAWIQVAPDQTWVRFTVQNTVWQFERDGTLHRSTEPMQQRKLEPLRRPRASSNGGAPTAITFVNRTDKPLSLFWLDTNRQPQPYQTVAAGEFLRRETYAGHVWQVKTASGDTLGIFQATEDESQAIIGGDEKTAQAQLPTEDADAPASEIDKTTATSRPQSFVRDYNLWLRGADGTPVQLTQDGTPHNFYREPVQTSPDGRYVVVSQVVPAQEHKVYEVESSPADQLQPKLKTVDDYLKPGDRIEQERPRLFDLQTRREVPTSDALFRNPWSIEDLGWSEDGQTYRFLFNQRGHQHLRVLEITKSGEVRAIVDESSSTFIDYSQKSYFHQVEGRAEMIWASERDGWNHLYLYNLRTRTMENQITKGAWVMREVVRVDDAKRQIWFRAFGLVPGQDPYYAQLARVNFDGSQLTVLTEGDGTHEWKLSPDNRFLIDSYSRVDLAPVTVLRDAATGAKKCDLESGDLEPLKNAGWSVPERFEAVGRDGKTPVYGVIIRPSNFDAARKYPVIENIYAGPQDFFAPKAFGTLTAMHELAELGFVVVQLDGMGTNWRSKAFHDVCWKNLKDAGFPDRIAWMRAAQQTRPWMDLERVGVYGTSAGGQNALGALLFHGDFYRAAIADCGCHDNRMDKIWWNEAWMGWPVGPQYADSSNVVHAANLKGALFLMVGELDDNVDPASTMQVVNALVKAEKDFDLLVVPGAGHGAGYSNYGQRRERDFFVRNLLGVEPPKRNDP